MPSGLEEDIHGSTDTVQLWEFTDYIDKIWLCQKTHLYLGRLYF